MEINIIKTMQNIADRVQERMNALGFTQETLSSRCGVEQPQISRLLDGTVKNPRYIYELSLALETSVKWLRTGVHEQSIKKIPESDIAHTSESQNYNKVFPLNTNDLIPMYGAVSASSPDIIHFTEDYMVEEVPRHPSVQKVKGAFAMLVAGDSMAPRHCAGEKVYIHPYQVPSIGQDCVILQDDGNAILKKFMGESAAEWKFTQLNPAKDFSISKSKVQKIFAVVR